MQIQVRLNGTLATFFAAPRFAVDLPEGATVAALVAELGARCPEASGALAVAIPVVGGDAASPATPLAEGREVALLMPISGGQE